MKSSILFIETVDSIILFIIPGSCLTGPCNLVNRDKPINIVLILSLSFRYWYKPKVAQATRLGHNQNKEILVVDTLNLVRIASISSFLVNKHFFMNCFSQLYNFNIFIFSKVSVEALILISFLANIFFW